MSITDDVRNIAAEAREPIRQWLEAAETITAFREVATKKELNWSALKAVIIASIKDEEDGGDRVNKLADKADDALMYAGALGNKIKFREPDPAPNPDNSPPVRVSVAAGTAPNPSPAPPGPNGDGGAVIASTPSRDAVTASTISDSDIPEFLRRPVQSDAEGEPVSSV